VDDNDTLREQHSMCIGTRSKCLIVRWLSYWSNAPSYPPRSRTEIARMQRSQLTMR